MDGTFRFRFADGEKMMSTALFLGLIWSGLWMAFLYVIMKYFPWEMLHDYPEDVRKASTLPEPTGKQKRNPWKYRLDHMAYMCCERAAGEKGSRIQRVGQRKT